MPDYICTLQHTLPTEVKSRVVIITLKSKFLSDILVFLWQHITQRVHSVWCAMKSKKSNTLKRLLSPYLVISSKNRVRSAWSELAAFRANTSKLQRSTSWGGGEESDYVIDAYLRCVYTIPCFVMSDLLHKHAAHGEIYDQWRLTLRQFTTAAGWSGMAAV